MIARCDDIRLEQAQMYGDVTGTPDKVATNAIYILVLPLHLHSGQDVSINPVVFRTFDAKGISLTLKMYMHLGHLSQGCVMYYEGNPNPYLAGPTSEQIKALTDFCKTIGITYIQTAIN